MSKPNAYHDALLEALSDAEEARHYLVAVLEEYPEGFRKALRNVAQAKQLTKTPPETALKHFPISYRA